MWLVRRVAMTVCPPAFKGQGTPTASAAFPTLTLPQNGKYFFGAGVFRDVINSTAFGPWPGADVTEASAKTRSGFNERLARAVSIATSKTASDVTVPH